MWSEVKAESGKRISSYSRSIAKAIHNILWQRMGSSLLCWVLSVLVVKKKRKKWHLIYLVSHKRWLLNIHDWGPEKGDDLGYLYNCQEESDLGETYVLLYGRKCVIPSFFLLHVKKQTRNGRSWSSFFITHICALIAINSSRAYIFYYDVLLIPQEKQTHHHRSTHPSTTSSVLDWTNINKNNIYTMKNVSIVLIALAGLVASSGT